METSRRTATTKVATDTNILDLQIQNQIRLVLLVLTDTKIQYHYGKMANFVSPNQMQIQIGFDLLVQPNTRDDTSQPWRRRCLSKKNGVV